MSIACSSIRLARWRKEGKSLGIAPVEIFQDECQGSFLSNVGEKRTRPDQRACPREAMPSMPVALLEIDAGRSGRFASVG